MNNEQHSSQSQCHQRKALSLAKRFSLIKTKGHWWSVWKMETDIVSLLKLLLEKRISVRLKWLELGWRRFYQQSYRDASWRIFLGRWIRSFLSSPVGQMLALYGWLLRCEKHGKVKLTRNATWEKLFLHCFPRVESLLCRYHPHV